MMIREITKILVIITIIFSSNCKAQESALFIPQLVDTLKSTINVQAAFKKSATKEDNQVNIINDTNSEATLHFISKDSGYSFFKKSNESYSTISIEKQDYWVVIYYKNINVDTLIDLFGNSQNQPGLEIIPFNALTQDEQTIELKNSAFSKVIGIADVKDVYGNNLLNSQLKSIYQINITFENQLLFDLGSEYKGKNLILGRTESGLEFTFINWFLLPSNTNELEVLTFAYSSEITAVESFYVDADLSKAEPVVIDFSLPFINEPTETAIGLQSNKYILSVIAQQKLVKYYGVNNSSNKNYHAVSLLIKDGQDFTRIAQSPTFEFEDSGEVYLTKHAESEGSSEFVKSFLGNNRISVNAQSTFFEQSVSFLVDKGKQIYVLGFGKPYESVGNYSDSTGSSYKLGLNGSYEVRCQEQIITSANEALVGQNAYETYSGDVFTSIEVPENNCTQLTLEYKYDSYLNDYKYTSSSSYKFDQHFAANNANGGIMITDIKLYENNQLVTNSVISKINPRLIIGSQFTLFPKLEVLAQLDEGDWIQLPEQTRSSKDSSITFVLPHSELSKVLNLKIIAGDDFEEIIHTLNGFAHIGIELDSDNDADSDGITNTEDLDDDNDGIEDSADIAPFDVGDWVFQTYDDTSTSTDNTSTSTDNNELDNSTSKPSGGNISILLLILLLMLAYGKPITVRFN